MKHCMIENAELQCVRMRMERGDYWDQNWNNILQIKSKSLEQSKRLPKIDKKVMLMRSIGK